MFAEQPVALFSFEFH